VPIYEYSCTKCGKSTEAMQKISDPPLTKCPSCGGKLAKMMSSTTFILKGSGWYATDYAKKGNGSGNGRSSRGADLKEQLKDKTEKKETTAASEKSTDTPSKPSKDTAND
jgi:putative FmdB family regulatory protein